MSTVVRNPLLETLNRLPILEPGQMEQLPCLAEQFPQPRILAKELLRRDWLTAYQINQIFGDRGDDLIIGHFLCLNKIGEGGMGHVFKARQRPFDRIVALKVLRRECLDNGKALQRFQREIRAVGDLHHPHIVRAYDADVCNGLHFIVMEHIEGVDLARMVKRQGPLAIEPALDFIRQAALGLQHAHDRGMVHRDIKPANLLVAQDTGSTRSRANTKFRWGMVKILDLGLARRSDPREASLTMHGSVMGTPDFIAPEQALNPHTCDSRADLYSLGCTLYYLIGGRIPFPRGGVTEKLLNHQMHEPEPLAVVRRARLMQEAVKTGKRIDESFYEIPEAVDAVVRKLMAKKPEYRFQTPLELARHIDRLLTPESSDPMSATHVAMMTQTNVILPPTPIAKRSSCRSSPTPLPPTKKPTLPAPTTMPMIELEPIDPPTPWRSLAESTETAAIVNVRLPQRTNPATTTRWWFVGAMCAIALSTTLLLQGQRNTHHFPTDGNVKIERPAK